MDIKELERHLRLEDGVQEEIEVHNVVEAIIKRLEKKINKS